MKLEISNRRNKKFKNMRELNNTIKQPKGERSHHGR